MRDGVNSRRRGWGSSGCSMRTSDRRRDRAGAESLHIWRNGDVVMWDTAQPCIAVAPWPAHEVRRMVRTTIFAIEEDGPETVRLPLRQAAPAIISR